MTSASLWNYCREKISDDNDNDASEGKSIKNTTKIIRKTEVRPPRLAQPPPNPKGSQPTRLPQLTVSPLNTEVFILNKKYLSKVWKSLDLSLINCEIELDL